MAGDPLASETITTPSNGVSATLRFDTIGATWNTETMGVDPEGHPLGVNWLWNNGTDSYIVAGAATYYQANAEEYLNTKTGQWQTTNPGASLLGGYEGLFTNGHGDYETRVYNVGMNLTAVQDHYADGSSDITVGSPGPNPNEPFNTLTTMFDKSGNVTALVENTSENGVSNLVVVTAAQLSASLENPGSTLTFMSHNVQLVLMSEQTTGGLTESQIYWQSVTGTADARAGVVQGVAHYVGAVIGAAIGVAAGVVDGVNSGVQFNARYDVAAIPDIGPALAAGVVGVSVAADSGMYGFAGWHIGGAIGDGVGAALQTAIDNGPSYNPADSEPGFDPSGGDYPGWTGGGGSNSIWHSDFVGGHVA